MLYQGISDRGRLPGSDVCICCCFYVLWCCYVHHRSSPELWLIFQLGLLLLFNTTIYLMQETDWQITNIISNLFKSTKLLACLKEKVENCDSPFFFLLEL